MKANYTADQNVNPQRLTDAVMRVLAANLSAGEQEKLRSIFPPHLREIWPAARKNFPTFPNWTEGALRQ